MTHDEIEALLSRIEGSLADPGAPWYGSNLVSWVADLAEMTRTLHAENTRLRQQRREAKP